jgi:tetratricopeptide (TPR) repeat protein
MWKSVKREQYVSKSEKQPQTKPAGYHKWFFSFVLMVVLPVSFLMLLELCLKLIGYGHPTGFFIQRQIEGRPVLTDNMKFSLRFFPPELARPSCHLAVPAEKPSGTFRIFVLGESAAMGDPDFSFGFSRMIEAMLRHQHPGVHFEVINAAITAINSNVVLPISRNCAKLEPDLFVVYLGNNEVIGPYGPGTVFAPFLSSLSFIRASIFLNSTRTGQLLSGLKQRFHMNEDSMRTWGGVDMFTHNRLRFNDKRMAAVYDHFRDNLTDICKVGHRAGAKVIVATVATNLRDCAPFGSLHRQSLIDASLKADAFMKAWEGFYSAGIASESSGQFEEAIEGYQKAAGIDDAFADLQFRLARCHWALEQYDKAHTHFIQARNLDALRFRADTRINKIIRKSAVDGVAEGVSLIDAEKAFQAESLHGIPGESLFYDHVHLNFSGNYLLARLVKEQAEKLLGMESRGHVLSEAECAERLAFTPWDRYRIQNEILGRMKSSAFANQLGNPESVRRLEARLDTIRRYLRPDALTEAVENYRHAMEGQEQDWVLRNNLGLLLLDAGNDPAGAAVQFRSVLRLFPFDYLTHNNLGLAFAQQGRLNEAVACYNEALRIKPDFSRANFNLGEVLERQGKNIEALGYFYRARLTQKQLADAHNRYGKRLVKENKMDEAAIQFEEALRLCPDSPDAHRNLGNVFARTGKTDLAIRHLMEAVRIRPDLARAHVDLASLLLLRGDSEGAIDHYKKALEIRPDLPEVQNNLGLALCKQGEFKKAILHFQKALSTRHDFLAARNNMAGALSQLGRNEEALVQLKESLRISPDNPDFHNNIGAELLKLGKIEEAITHFKKALQLKPNSSSAQNNLNYALSRLHDIDESKRSK